MVTTTTDTTAARQVGAADWTALADELDAYGCALTPRLLTPERCRAIAGLYERAELFRTTVDMARHRFGSGQYRYFTHDLPEPVAELRRAFYPHLLGIARDWAARLGRPAPGPRHPGGGAPPCPPPPPGRGPPSPPPLRAR